MKKHRLEKTEHHFEKSHFADMDKARDNRGGPGNAPAHPRYVLLRIARLRRQRHLAPKEVAGILGISTRTYTAYEEGTRRMPLDIFMRLAKFYDVSLDYITGASNLIRRYPTC